MTQEQLNNLTKEELNVALTPYMGGFTKQLLKNTKKGEMVEMLTGYMNTSAKKSKTKVEKLKSIDVVLEMIEEKEGATVDEMAKALVERLSERYAHRPEKAKQYVRLAICDLKNPNAVTKKNGLLTISYDKESKKYIRLR